MYSLILIFFVTVFFYLFFKKKYSYWKELGVPGPRPLPFIGNFLDDTQLNGKEVEKKFFNDYGPVFGTYSGIVPLFNTCEPEHIKQVLGDVNTFQNFGLFFINDKYIHKSIFFLNTHKWKEGRKVVSGHFTSRRLKSLIEHFQTVTNNFLNNIEFIKQTKSTQVINMREMSKFYATDMIAKYVFAVDIDSFQEHENGSEFAKQALQVGDINLLHIILMNFMPEWLAKMLGLNIFKTEPLDRLGDIFKKMIRKRDSYVRYEDLSELLQDAVNDNKVNMSEDEIIANCILSMFAGIDTTSRAIDAVFYFLMQNPTLQNKLYKKLADEFDEDQLSYEKLMEHEYLDAFISESLRLGQSLLVLDKVCAKDTVLEKGNYKLKKGTVIWLITYLNHINGQYFPEPDRFDPERFLDKSPSNPNIINNGTYLPFSTGNRACIGMRFALLEIKYLIARVLLNYELIMPKDFKLEEISRRRFCYAKNMHVCFKKREKRT